MEELRKIAGAYFKVASNDIKKETQNFFDQMDYNHDGSVSLHEFLDFMRQEQYLELRSSDLFKQLCRGNKEKLKFMDVMTLYYIIRSGRPFCDGCNQFIKDIYFCCIQCFHKSKRNYCLCTQCFEAKKYTTRSNHQHQFVDNFTLLELKRKDALKGAPASNQQASISNVTRTHVSSVHIEPCDEKNDGETSLAIVAAGAATKANHHKRRDPGKLPRNDRRKPQGSSSHIKTPNAAAAGSSTSLQLVPAGAATEERHRKRKAKAAAAVALQALETVLVGGAAFAQIIGCSIM